MNRRGFTAVMDATFFIILISLAVTILSGVGVATDNCSHEDLSDVCDTLMTTQMTADSFGYEDGRLMKVSDLAAISLMKGDGKIGKYLTGYFDALYPWDNAYGVSMTYGNHVLEFGEQMSECGHSVIREYAVEYGGSLTVEICLSA